MNDAVKAIPREVTFDTGLAGMQPRRCIVFFAWALLALWPLEIDAAEISPLETLDSLFRNRLSHHSDLHSCRKSDLLNGIFSGGIFSRGKKRRDVVLLPRKQNYDYNVAKKMAEFASVAYCYDDNALQKWTCARCAQIPEFLLTRFIADVSWDVSGYVGYYPPWNAKIVAFRGTHGRDLRNWMENLRFNRHSVRMNLTFPGVDKIRVHNGFSRVWNIPFKENVISAVKQLHKTYGEEGPLYIVGHSSGGATAQLAAFSLKILLEVPDVRLYTFGAPRVGNWLFAKMLAEIMTESWRFTHNRDPVPMLPFMRMGFWHVSQEVFQKENKIVARTHTITSYCMCDGTGEDPYGHDSMCGFGLGCTSVDDHYFYLNIIMENDGSC